MNVTLEQITEKLKTLPENILEKVSGYIDALAESETSLDIPEWQQNEVRERLRKYKKESSSAQDLDDVLTEIEEDL